MFLQSAGEQSVTYTDCSPQFQRYHVSPCQYRHTGNSPYQGYRGEQSVTSPTVPRPIAPKNVTLDSLGAVSYTHLTLPTICSV
eukprot:7653997-Prorocentrum_lima.AAC.1